MEHELSIDSNRLLSAADALLEAISSTDGKNALVEVRLDDPAAPGGTHPTMRAFTAAELSEAMDLLIRLGLVPRQGGGTTPANRRHRRS